MRYIPCTIETLRTGSEDFWIIKVPTDAVETAASLLSELLSDSRKRIVFLARNAEFTLTAETAVYNGRSVSVTSDFLECLKKLFSVDIRPGISHLDWDFSDRYRNIGITVSIE